MTTRLKTFSVLSGTVLVAIALATTVAGQQPPPAATWRRRTRTRRTAAATGGAGRDIRQGKLVIWGDIASFDNRRRCRRIAS